MATIAYLNHFPADNALEIFADNGLHDVVKIDGSQPLTDSMQLLEHAHVYQCVGARDEVPAGLRVDAEFLRNTPNLLMVSASGSGVDVFDLDACTAAGVLAVNQSGANAESVAEHTLAMMLSLQKRISYADRELRSGWRGARSQFFGRDLLNRTVGIVGLGHIGQRLAEICHHAFQCKILACDPYLDSDTIASKHAVKVDLDELMSQSDVVSIHTPLTTETHHMINHAALSRMKQGSILICTARGSIIDEVALEEHLVSGHVAGAGLDVFEQEPPESHHPLLALDNVIATPHVAGGTYNSLENMARYAATQIIDVVAGAPPARPVNDIVLPAFYARRKQLLGV